MYHIEMCTKLHTKKVHRIDKRVFVLYFIHLGSQLKYPVKVNPGKCYEEV